MKKKRKIKNSAGIQTHRCTEVLDTQARQRVPAHLAPCLLDSRTGKNKINVIINNIDDRNGRRDF